MKSLDEAVQDYLALRRSLGFKLKPHQRYLREFVSFLQERAAQRITTRLALQWAAQPEHLPPAVWGARLTAVRGFARYLSATDPATEVPPPGLLPYRPPRAKPYLYSDNEILQLLEAAKTMQSCHSLLPWTYYSLLGLLAVTGMRISEALSLQTGDVDWSEGVLTIRETKFKKTRLLPLHASTLKILADYASRRDEALPVQKSAPFFLSSAGVRLHGSQVRTIFSTLSKRVGLREPGAGRGPRLHDFRHRFAVQTLLNWYRNVVDVRRRAPILSTFLGHAHVTDTYWYISSTPELMTAVCDLLEKRWERIG